MLAQVRVSKLAEGNTHTHTERDWTGEKSVSLCRSLPSCRMRSVLGADCALNVSRKSHYTGSGRSDYASLTLRHGPMAFITGVQDRGFKLKFLLRKGQTIEC